MYGIELKTKIQRHLINDSGFLIRCSYLPKYIDANNLGELVQQIIHETSFLDTNRRFDERVYCILNDLIDVPMCMCGKFVKFKRFGLGYAEYCSCSCRANDKKWQAVSENSKLQKYGVRHIAQLPVERIKRAEQIQATREIMDYSNAPSKTKATKQLRYGDRYNSGWNEKAVATRINNGNMVPLELMSEYLEYYRSVSKVTKKQPLVNLDHIEKRGVLGKDDDAYHIDHMVSIYDGFMNNVSAEIIGSIVNLQCIPGRDNIKKGNKSSITIDELLERYNAYVGI